MPVNKRSFHILLLFSFIHLPLQAQIRHAVDTTYHFDSSCEEAPVARFQVKGKYLFAIGTTEVNEAIKNLN